MTAQTPRRGQAIRQGGIATAISVTTFSALMMETLVFARAGRGALVPLYLGVTLVGGMLLVWLGARLAEATR
jgi:fluoride ion exporter CrcB/FEX